MDRATLSRLIATRPPYATDSIIDPLTLALDLLRGESIARAIERLDRDALALLERLGRQDSGSAAAGATPASTEHIGVAALTDLALLGTHNDAPVALTEVTDTLVTALTAAQVDLQQGQGTDSAGGSVPGSATGSATAPAAVSAALSAAVPSTVQAATNDPRGHHDWFVAALTSTQQAAAILRALQQQAGKVNRRGDIAVVTLRALAELTHINVDTVRHTLHTLSVAGLTTTTSTRGDSNARLVPTPAASAWLQCGYAERWVTLVQARVQALTPEIRLTLNTVDNLHLLAAALGTEFPLLPDAPRAECAEFVLAAEALGMTADGLLTDVAREVISSEPEAATTLATQHMPEPVAGVYVQPDLSVIVPGPLSAQDETLLLSIADSEQVGVASTLRITPASLARALERGHSADTIRSELSRLSLTGVPQPINFLLDEIKNRTSILVHAHSGAEGRSRIEVAQPELSATLQVDRAVHHLQLSVAPAAAAQEPSVVTAASDEVTAPPLTPHATTAVHLFSRLGPEHVLSALTDARYSAIAGAQVGGTQVAGTTNDDTPSTSTSTQGADATAQALAPSAEELPNLSPEFTALVDRVLETASIAPGEGDVSRRLDLAIRAKTPVKLTAAARGQEREFVLLPVSLARGRLRATDVAAGVERTLPIEAIVSVVPAP